MRPERNELSHSGRVARTSCCLEFLRRCVKWLTDGIEITCESGAKVGRRTRASRHARQGRLQSNVEEGASLRHTSHRSCGHRRLPAANLRCLFVYAALGCVASLTSSAGTTTYTYDVHGRLKVVRAPTGSDQTATTHVYDAAGNRESVVTAFEDITLPNPPTGLSAAAAQAFDLIRLSGASGCR